MDYGISKITDRIYLGGQFENLADANALRALGITHVINCREVTDPDYIIASFINCWPQPAAPDDGTPRTKAWFCAGINFWSPLDWVSWWTHAKLYVHCHAGLNRSASMVYALLRAHGIQAEDAVLLIDKHRPIDVVGIRYRDEADSLFV